MNICFIGPKPEALCGNDTTGCDRSKYSSLVYTLASNLKKLLDVTDNITFISPDIPGFSHLTFWAVNAMKRTISDMPSGTISNAVYAIEKTSAKYTDGIFGKNTVDKMFCRADVLKMLPKDRSEINLIHECIANADVAIILGNSDKLGIRMPLPCSTVLIDYKIASNGIVFTDITCDSPVLESIFRIDNFVQTDADDSDVDIPVIELSEDDKKLIIRAIETTKCKYEIDAYMYDACKALATLFGLNIQPSIYDTISVDCIHHVLTVLRNTDDNIDIDKVDDLDDRILHAVSKDYRLSRPVSVTIHPFDGKKLPAAEKTELKQTIGNSVDRYLSAVGQALDCTAIVNAKQANGVEEYLQSENIRYAKTIHPFAVSFHVSPKDYEVCNNIVHDMNMAAKIFYDLSKT